MKKTGEKIDSIARTFPLSWMLAFSLLLSGCAIFSYPTGVPNSLDPRGTGAAEIAFLWWVMFALGIAVFLVVTGITIYIIVARNRHPDDNQVEIEAPSKMGWIWWGGVIIPGIILAIVFFFTLRSMRVIANTDPNPTVVVEVIGWRWWWEVRYPAYGITTANQIHIPVGQEVRLRLTSGDVIHSFWVPELQGKMDMNPGETNTFWFQADEPGVFRGLCAEFCGLQHARMQFMVVVESQEDFEAWLEREQQPAAEPVLEGARMGQEIFMGTTCAFCHTVRGTNATGDVGPDLTHLASRLTIAAGVLQNNRGNLGGWIVDPQHIKPGSLMPPANLNSVELQALLDYLETLE